MEQEPVVLVDGICFGEAPRWRDGNLYISDMYAGRILKVHPSGGFDVVAEFETPVSGLGWLPDGRMLVVSMYDRKILRREPGGDFVEHADLSDVATWHANDMVVTADGTAYVGNFGFQIAPVRFEERSAAVAKVTATGVASAAAADLRFPNGMVITPDGRTLVVAESLGKRLTAFDIVDNGALLNRRVWGNMEPHQFPDGICLNAAGEIWIASPPSREVVRMREGGEIVERIPVGQQGIACMLGGSNRKTLFILTAEERVPEWCQRNRSARVLAVPVDTPGAGWP